MEIVSTLRNWVGNLAKDAEIVYDAATDESASRELREYSCAALNYLLTRMDLVPDWTESIGAVDDVLIMRWCVALGGDAPEGASYADDLRRLAFQADELPEIVGEENAARLKHYCVSLRQKEVRGRTPASIIEEESQQKQLWQEVQDTVASVAAPVFEDAEKDILNLKAFLGHKLKPAE